MSEPDPIVNRIDALVRKRRSFVATPSGETAAPLADPGIEAEELDDIPVLTEIVEVAEDAEPEPPAPSDVALEPILDTLANDLTAAVETRLAADLPGIVEQALAQFGLELRRGIADAIETAKRDFLARQRQLDLPLADAQPDE